MTRFLLPLALLAGAGCSENEVTFRDVGPEVPADGGIRGQICDDVNQVWLEGATVYTHLYDDDGVVYDTVTDITDAEGNFVLALPTGRYYEVFVAYRNDLVQQFGVDVPADQVLELPTPTCFGDVDLSVAVVTGAYDDLAVLFQAIGIGSYKEVDGQASGELVDFLSDPVAMAEYQVIFFDGGHTEAGILYPIGDPQVDQFHTNLKQYVAGGGVVFASDWAYDTVEQVWPDRIDFMGDDAIPDAAQLGEPGDLNATLADSGMASILGFGQTTVAYDMSVYPVIEGVGPDTHVYLTAGVPYRLGQTVEVANASPIAVSFDEGDGRVYFTGYRNSVNGAGDMLEVLRYMLETAIQ